MKNVFKLLYSKWVKLGIFFLFLYLFIWGNTAVAQTANIVPFKHQVGANAPEGNLFRIRGDFTIIGNTSLTLAEYGDNLDNSLEMVYVDVDGDPNTFNSSSATLLLSEENGADQKCSEILYAGLYWAGKAAVGRPLEFPLTKHTKSDTQMVVEKEEQVVLLNDKVRHSSYTMSFSMWSVAEGLDFPAYFFTSSEHQEVVFHFTNDIDSQVIYKIGHQDWKNVNNLVITNAGDSSIATFDPVKFEDGGITLSVHTLKRSLLVENFDDKDFSVGLTASGSYFPILTHTVMVDKRKVKLKGPGASGYTEIKTQGNRIMYPHGIYADIYVGYADITNLVKSHGVGEYTVADMALTEGYGDQTGSFGNWGIIVIYQNSQMDWRDVTVFDGYSYVRSDDLREVVGEIEVSGFGTVNKGPVNLKLGVMAGEGDRTIDGDFLQIINQKGSWVNLNHELNSRDNFFNSSIYTPVKDRHGYLIQNPRNPFLTNNTGIDIVQWDVPNPNNSVIANGQTSVRFRYGTKQDLYVIYALAFSVPSFVPEIQAHHSLHRINGNPIELDSAATPGQEITYKIDIKNRGSEESDQTKIVIPLPVTVSFVRAQTAPEGRGTVTFDPEMGVNGSIVWELGEIPVSADPDEVIATLEYTVKITEECRVLSNVSCEAKISVEGSVSGIGRISQSAYSNLPFIIGFAEGECAAEAIYGALEIPIEGISEFADSNCHGEDGESNLGPINLPIFCQTDPPTDLSSMISPSMDGFTVYFFTEEEGGAALTNYQVNTALPGTEQIWVAQGLTSSCTGVRQPVTIRVIPKVSEPRVQHITVCQNGPPVSYQVIRYTVNFDLNYYLDANPESLPLDYIPVLDPLEEGVHSIWVSHTKEGMCESNRVQVRIIVEDCSMHPAIEIRKTADKDRYSVENDTITYTLEISNPRNVRLYQVEVYDGLTNESWTIPYLYENSSQTLTTKYVTKKYDLDSRVISNYAYASGTTDKNFTVGNQAYLEIYALVFPEGFLNYAIRSFPENCVTNGDAKGSIEIVFQQNQVGTYSLTRQSDGQQFGGEFINRRSIQIMVPHGLYTLSITDQEGNTHAIAGTYEVEKQEFVAFTIPKVVDACYPYFFIPESTESLIFKVVEPNGSLITQSAAGDFTLLKSGQYRITGTDPTGKRCPLEKSFQANIDTPQGINLEVSPFCREDVFTTIFIQQDVGRNHIRWYQLSNAGPLHLKEYDNRTTLTVLDEGLYQVTLSDEASCIVAMDQIEVTQSFNLPPPLGSLYTICTARSLSVLLEVGASFSSCKWFLEGMLVGNELRFTPGQAGKYSLLASDSQGCEFFQDFEVEDACDAMIRYPNAIRPGDPLRSFMIYPDNLTGELEVFIQNRWGELIYHCEDKTLKSGQPSKCTWDGIVQNKIVPNGVYSVFIRYQTKEKNLTRTEKGVITVVN